MKIFRVEKQNRNIIFTFYFKTEGNKYEVGSFGNFFFHLILLTILKSPTLNQHKCKFSRDMVSDVFYLKR